MKAMIFAAGLGTRLFPITNNRPKALAPFLEGTLLSYNLHFLAQQGITDFVINTHHYADLIETYLKENQNFGYNIQISYEVELLDTAGGLAKAKSLFVPDEDILLFNVDIITNIDIHKMKQFYKSSNSIACLALRNRTTSRYLLFDKENTLIGWTNKKNDEIIWSRERATQFSEFAFSGIQWVNFSLIKDIPKEKMSITPLYLKLAKTKDIKGYLHNDDYWFDCGKMESLKQAETFIKENS